MIGSVARSNARTCASRLIAASGTSNVSGRFNRQPEWRLQLRCQPRVGVPHFFEQDLRCPLKSAGEFNRFQRASQALRGSCLMFVGEVIQPSTLHSTYTVAPAHQRQGVVAHPAQHIFSLQQARARHARSHMEGVQPCHPDELIRIRTWGRPRFSRKPEDHAEFWTRRTKFAAGPEGEIDLQAVIEQKNPVQDVATPDVAAGYRLVVAIHTQGPVSKHLIHVSIGRQRQREVNVRPAILEPDSCRAEMGGTGNTCVRLCGRNQFPANPFSLLRREDRKVSSTLRHDTGPHTPENENPPGSSSILRIQPSGGAAPYDSTGSPHCPL